MPECRNFFGILLAYLKIRKNFFNKDIKMKYALTLLLLCLSINITLADQSYELDPIGRIPIPIPIPIMQYNFFPASLEIVYEHPVYKVKGLIYNTGRSKFSRRLPVMIETFDIEHPRIPLQRRLKSLWSRVFYVNGPIDRVWYKFFKTSIPSSKLPFEGYIKITVDPHNIIRESNESDNTGHVGQHGVY